VAAGLRPLVVIGEDSTDGELITVVPTAVGCTIDAPSAAANRTTDQVVLLLRNDTA
jgi:hypothetical protein